MKKFLGLFLALMMALGLAACTSKDDAKKDTVKDTPKETAAPKVDVKKEIVKFYMELGDKINAKDVDLNTYEKKAAKPEELPTADEKAKASESAAAVAAELTSTQIPEGLKDQKADLEAALKDYASSYQAKADELKKDTPNLEAADATFAQAEEKLGKVFESAKLLPPSLGMQVN